jgi:Transposase DDE domain
MFRDERRCKVWEEIRQHGLRAFGRFLSASVFAEAARRAGVGLGQSALGLPTLVVLGLGAAFHRAKSFADVLVLTVKLLEDSEHWSDSPLATARRNSQRTKKRRGNAKRSKHDPRGGDPTVVSEEAFVQARQRMPLRFWASLLAILVERFQETRGEQLRWHEFRLMALDGTTVNLPNWKALREHFGCAKNGKSWRAQARMVMLQFPLARLPFRYELGTLAEGERAVASRLLTGLCCNDLVLMDQGFWSYHLFWQIERQGAYFAIRKFAQAHFRTLKKLGSKDRLVEWKPSDPRQRRGLPESIRLRVIDYQIKGFRPTGVVTNVLNPQRISREAWIHLATKEEEGRLRLTQGLYHRRWEIETTYCELKVTQGMETGLRSRTPEGVAYEVAGHVLLYFLTRWLIVEAAATANADPLRISFKQALEELLDMAVTLITTPAEHVARVLLPRLLARIVSHRVPFRPGRSYPRPRDGRIKDHGHGKTRCPHKL